jgi:hypothetical protein
MIKFSKSKLFVAFEIAEYNVCQTIPQFFEVNILKFVKLLYSFSHEFRNNYINFDGATLMYLEVADTICYYSP